MTLQRRFALTPSLRLVLALLCALSTLLFINPPLARAGNVVGNGTPTSCTEAAIRSATADGGTVSFNCGPGPVTIVVTDDIVITKDVEIDGGGMVILSGAGTARMMRIEGAKVVLRNLTFRDGFGGQGGALRIMFFADVTILDCAFLNNSSNWGYEEEGGGAISVRTSKLAIYNSLFDGNKGVNGGAIYSLLTPLTVENSTFVNNDSTHGGETDRGFGAGGAISTDGASYPVGNTTGGDIIIRNSVFRGNRAAGAAGAAFTYGYPPADRVIIEGSLFEDNSVSLSVIGAAGGGAIRHGGVPLYLRNSLFVHNHATRSGGALWASRADGSRIENVTFVANDVHSDNGRGQGGALYLSTGSFDLVNTTIVGNYADYFAGAIFAESDNTALWNTIVANNSANDGTRWNQCGRTLSRGANNIMYPQGNGDNSGDYLCSPGISHSDPLLGELGDYGGLTRTLPILAGSPAINAGVNCPSTDARGAARVGACDIGAFEFGGTPPGYVPPDPPSLEPLQTDGSPLIQMRWSSMPGASYYRVEVGADSDFNSMKMVFAENENHHNLVIGSGTYYLRVNACNAAGCSDYSEVREATITSDPEYIWMPILR